MKLVEDFGEAWIAYIDLYGFSAQVRRDTPAATYKTLAECLKEIAELTQASGFTLQALSDSIFIVGFLGGRHGNDPLSAFLHCLRAAQDKLVAAGFLPRGALAAGEVYISPGLIVGEPVIRAVRDEQCLDIPCFVIPSRELRGNATWLRHETIIPIKGGGAFLGVPLFPENIEPYLKLITERLNEALLNGPPTVAAAYLRLKDQLREWTENERDRTRRSSASPDQKSKTPRSAKLG
jgi:hypothetical protein